MVATLPRWVDYLLFIHSAWEHAGAPRSNHTAVTSSELLAVVLGRAIRSAREAAGLTQAKLGSRSGIDGKYVSEIERGTRNVPLSTLHAIVKKGLGLELDIRFDDAGKPGPAPLPAVVEVVARSIAALPAKQQRAVLGAIELILSLAKR